MFKKIKRNTTRIEFDESEVTESVQANEHVKEPRRNRISFDDEAVQPIKKIKLVANVSPAIRPVTVPVHEAPRDYTTAYMLDLLSMNKQQAFDAREHMIQASDEDQREMHEQQAFVIDDDSASDDSDRNRRTKSTIEQKNRVRQEQDYIGTITSNEMVGFTDQNWVRDTSQHRIPMVANEVHRGEYDSLPSEDEEFNRFEQSCINGNSTRKAQIRAATVFQEGNYKATQFNDKRSRQGSQLVVKIQSVSWDSLLRDAAEAIEVDSSHIKRTEREIEQLDSATASSDRFVNQWSSQLKELNAELDVAQEQQEYLVNFHDMAKEKIPILFALFDELNDVVDDYVTSVQRNISKSEFEIPYDELFADVLAPRFILRNYVTKLDAAIEDVDDQYCDPVTLVQHVKAYLESTKVSEESTIRYVSAIVYPIFKFQVLKCYLNSFIYDQPFTYLEQLTSLDQTILANLLASLSRTTFEPLIRLNIFLTAQLEQLLMQSFQRMYSAKTVRKIKATLTYVVDTAKLDCGLFTVKKLTNLRRLNSLLPQAIIDECAAVSMQHLQQALTNQPVYVQEALLQEADP